MSVWAKFAKISSCENIYLYSTLPCFKSLVSLQFVTAWFVICRISLLPKPYKKTKITKRAETNHWETKNLKQHCLYKGTHLDSSDRLRGSHIKHSYTPRTLRTCCSQSELMILKIHESSVRASLLYNCTPNTLQARA